MQFAESGTRISVPQIRLTAEIVFFLIGGAVELSECPTGLLVFILSLVHDLFCIFSFPMLVAKYHAM